MQQSRQKRARIDAALNGTALPEEMDAEILEAAAKQKKDDEEAIRINRLKHQKKKNRMRKLPQLTFEHDTIYVARSVADHSFLATCPARQVTTPAHATIFVVNRVLKPPPMLLLAALFNGCKITSKAHVTSQGRGAAVQYRCICSRPKNRSLWLSPDFVARNRSAMAVITHALLRPSSNWVLARQHVEIKLKKK